MALGLSRVSCRTNAALLLFYDTAPEENFPAQCRLLLDRTAPRYLDIESIVVLGEEFAGRLTGG